MVGAQSAKGFRMVAVPIIFLDDIDGFLADVDGEGDPVALAMQRAKNFFNKKIFLISSPTIKGVSRIENSFLQSDMRFYFVPCSNCGEYQKLEFERIRWESRQPETAGYVCEFCEFKHLHSIHKAEMLRGGDWQATAESKGHAGFHLSRMYSPFIDFTEIASEWLECFEEPLQKKVFINTVLGKTYERDAERIDADYVNERAEDYGCEVPKGAVFLTAGVDVQKNRLECEVIGWGKSYENWSIHYEVFFGSVTFIFLPFFVIILFSY